MPDIYISIGSNVEREKNIQHAITLLAVKFSNINCSRVYESEAVGFVGNTFYNLVVKTSTKQSLENVLQTLKKIELDCGRNNTDEKFAPRPIDLDLLLFGNKILHNENIDLPRTDILRYAFVLLPLSELAPDLQHPELKTSFSDLWQGFAGEKNKQKRVSFLPTIKTE